MSGDFVCEARAAGWRADRIEEAADLYSAPDVERARPPAHFHVFARRFRDSQPVPTLAGMSKASRKLLADYTSEFIGKPSNL